MRKRGGQRFWRSLWAMEQPPMPTTHLSSGGWKRRGQTMTLAMEEAGVQPEEVEYINAHGTGTAHNDLFETRAIKAAFGEAAKKVSINSTKSMTGHLLGAAGGVECIVCVKALQEGFIHQTMGTTETEGEMDLDYTIGAPKERNIRYAMSNSLGFGGHNATILLKAYEEEEA